MDFVDAETAQWDTHEPTRAAQLSQRIRQRMHAPYLHIAVGANDQQPRRMHRAHEVQQQLERSAVRVM